MSSEPGWPEGVGRLILAETDSTNAEALRRAEGDLPLWILARRQTAGRGRRGRVWASAEGNFAATLAMRPAEDAATVALRSFVAALALHDALAGLVAETRLALKWPNDVLLDGKKLAGILLESAGAGQGVARLAIGIGVNLAAAPPRESLPPEALPPVALAEAGPRIAPEDFLDRLAPAYAARERVFATLGFEPIRTAWLSRAARLGGIVTARTGRETLTGRFETLDASGALVLKTADGRRAIPAAEIFFEEARA